MSAGPKIRSSIRSLAPAISTISITSRYAHLV